MDVCVCVCLFVCVCFDMCSERFLYLCLSLSSNIITVILIMKDLSSAYKVQHVKTGSARCGIVPTVA